MLMVPTLLKNGQMISGIYRPAFVMILKTLQQAGSKPVRKYLLHTILIFQHLLLPSMPGIKYHRN